MRTMRNVVMEPMPLLLIACGTFYLLLGGPGEALMLLGFVLVVIGLSFFSRGEPNGRSMPCANWYATISCWCPKATACWPTWTS